MSNNKKKLNSLKASTVSFERKLNDLRTQHDQMVKDASEAVELDKGESESAQVSFNVFSLLLSRL